MLGKLRKLDNILLLAFVVMVSISTKPPNAFILLLDLFVVLPSMLFLLCWRFLIEPATIRIRLEHGFLTRPEVLFLNIVVVLGLPAVAAAVAHFFSWKIIADACPEPRMLDYTLLVLDSLAKGALLDFMESYNLHLYRCEPNPSSFAASTIVFVIRLYSTFVFVWVGWRLAKSWRRKLNV